MKLGFDEQSLVERARRGEDEAFNDLMAAYLQRIYSLCFGLTGNQQDAEDCTQESFLKAYRGLGHYQAKSSFYTWIYRIAVNVCMDFQRSRKSQPAFSLDQTLGEDDYVLQIRDESPLPDDEAISHELGDQLRFYIAQLSDPLRDVLILRDLEGLSYDEIARLLNLSEGTVKSRLFRARSQVMKGMRSIAQQDALNLMQSPAFDPDDQAGGPIRAMEQNESPARPNSKRRMSP